MLSKRSLMVVTGETPSLSTSGATLLPTVKASGADRAALLSSLRSVVDSDASESQAFYVFDLGDVYRKDQLWRRALPRIDPFYAVKCNTDPVLLQAMASMGLGFDCASRAEIEAALRMGTRTDRIIFANPCKSIPHLRFAREQGVRRMTFDNAEELEKIATHHPQAECVLRVLADDSKSACRLGLKFGAARDTIRPLMARAAALNLAVIGVSFHVGSGCTDATAFADAVARARFAFDVAESCGHQPTLLDVGGGFPGICGTSAFDAEGAGASGAQIGFDDIAVELRAAVDRYFPEGCGVQIIGEPGRFYVTSACHLAVQVIAKRRIEHAGGAAAERERELADEANADALPNPAQTAAIDTLAEAVEAAALADADFVDAFGASTIEDGNRMQQDDASLDSANYTTAGTTADDEAAAAAHDGDESAEAAVGVLGAEEALALATGSSAMVVDEAPSSGTASPPPEGDPTFMYYVNDGVYGAFNCIVFDHQLPRGMPLYDMSSELPLYESSVWGPTCDSLDKIEPGSQLPELRVGDWLLYPNMGAYTMAAASNFNGFAFARKFYTFSVASETDIEHLPANMPVHPHRIPEEVGLVNLLPIGASA